MPMEDNITFLHMTHIWQNFSKLGMVDLYVSGDFLETQTTPTLSGSKGFDLAVGLNPRRLPREVQYQLHVHPPGLRRLIT
jgi:hypothetical protein